MGRTPTATCMVCLGTNYQLIEKVRSKEPLVVWLAFMRSWARFLGFPQVLLLDQGTEFDRASRFGILLHTIGARAPHQNGRCERHGGLFKAMVEKARWSNPPASPEDLKLLVREVEAAKNCLSDRSGYSPAQRMIGETPKPTGELLSDAIRPCGEL